MQDFFSSHPLMVFGFHGCKASVASRVINGLDQLRPSDNRYDWLGSGIYFWENAPARALEWASARFGPEAAVVGAVIQLGSCLNLMDKACNMELRQAYEFLAASGAMMPSNHGKAHDLDKLVIQTAAQFHRLQNGRDFDTVRGAFVEGEPIYPDASIMADTHIQLCVRNPAAIVACFLPRTIPA